MKAILKTMLLACLLIGCGEDSNIAEESQAQALDFNLVTIEDVSEPSVEGIRTITLNFSDRDGNTLRMKAGSGYKHLEAGWYDITSEANGRLKAEIVLECMQS